MLQNQACLSYNPMQATRHFAAVCKKWRKKATTYKEYAKLKIHFKSNNRDQQLASTAGDSRFAGAINVAQAPFGADNNLNTMLEQQSSQWAATTTVTDTAAALGNLNESRSEDQEDLGEMRTHRRHAEASELGNAWRRLVTPSK